MMCTNDVASKFLVYWYVYAILVGDGTVFERLPTFFLGLQGLGDSIVQILVGSEDLWEERYRCKFMRGN